MPSASPEIKKREYFTPFAPSVLENYENKIFDLKCPSPFMLIATSIKSKYRKAKKEKNG